MPLDIYWSADQIQGQRQYQEDVYAVIDGDYVWMPEQRLDLTGLSLASNVSVYLLADGMGGMGHGDYAAKLAIQTVVDHLIASWSEALSVNELNRALALANDTINKEVRINPDYEGMGCTFIGVIVDKVSGKIDWVSIGDSLLMLNQGGSSNLLNTKHIWRNWALVTGNSPSEKEAELAAQHGEALFSALDGTVPLVHMQSSAGQEVLNDGDILIVASDGIEVVSTQSLVDSLNSSVLKFRNSESKASVDTSLADIQKNILSQVEQLGLEHQDNASVILIGARQAG